MKSFYLILQTVTVGLALTSIANAADLQPAKAWVKADQRVVYFAPSAELRVTLTHLGADDNYWDQLDIALAYDGATTEQQAQGLKQAYPGYQIRRAVISAHGSLIVSVPALSVSAAMEPKPGQEGPYLNYTTFLNKAQSESFRRSFESDANSVQVMGQITAGVPQSQVVEHVELDSSACDTLLAHGKTFFEAIRGYSEVHKEIDSRDYQYVETKTALERSVLETCLDVPVERGAGSFHELLSMPARIKARAGNPVGETRREVPSSAIIPIGYRLTKTVQPGGES